MKFNNLPTLILAGIIFILAKFWYASAELNDILFLITPTNFFVEIFLGTKSTFQENVGFVFENHQFIINKSCSGFNFWMISFILFTFLTIKNATQRYIILLAIPNALFLAYLLTILANSSRILASVVFQLALLKDSIFSQEVLHEVIGVSTNVTFLILAYLFGEKIIQARINNLKDHELKTTSK